MKSARGFTPILIILIVLGSVVVGAGASYFYFRFKTPLPPIDINEMYGTNQTPQPQTSPVSIPASDETANWKIYQNSKFSLRYPDGYTVIGTNPTLLQSSDLKKIASERGTNITQGAEITINFTSIPTSGDKNEDFNEYFHGDEGPEVKATGNIPISDIQAITYSYVTPEKNEVEGAFFVYNNKIVIASIVTSYESAENYKETFDQILSTFKFLD